jgi:hypothetical protein
VTRMDQRIELAALFRPWLPYRPKYVNRDERKQYQAARAAFLEHDRDQPPRGQGSPREVTHRGTNCG